MLLAESQSWENNTLPRLPRNFHTLLWVRPITMGHKRYLTNFPANQPHVLCHVKINNVRILGKTADDTTHRCCVKKWQRGSKDTSQKEIVDLKSSLHTRRQMGQIHGHHCCSWTKTRILKDKVILGSKTSTVFIGTPCVLISTKEEESYSVGRIFSWHERSTNDFTQIHQKDPLAWMNELTKADLLTLTRKNKLK